uniref:Alcohol dehydrogenase n=1 Tax=Trepomonas sp. PC1 TaxID=1076344 RepID=A0A146K987_9EUKA|eukprot:JAP92504.1 Alcohol dehydrogenase [Trepomonas sp. PC1]
MTIENFEWYNPTKLIVKADAGPEIADYISKDGHTSVLLAYGQQAIKKIGLYDKIVAALRKHNITIYELPGIRANPEIKKVVEGINICRQHNIECVLAVGGGSTYDSCKAIIAGAKFPVDVSADKIWECFEGTRKIEAALPLYGVLTISATGTEMNYGGVVQDDEQKKKWDIDSVHCFPKVSIVDPKLQTFLPWYQQVNGFIDAIIHILEYLTNVDDSQSVETTFAINISMIRSIIKCGNVLQQKNDDYNARANFCWAATCALNQLSGVAMNYGCWAVHLLEHAMAAIDPSISHGAGLGVAFPAFVKVNASKGQKLQTYDRIAKEVFEKEGWQGLVEGFQDLLRKWKHPLTLNELYKREVGQEEREQLIKVYMMKPIGNYQAETNVEEFVREVYKVM